MKKIIQLFSFVILTFIFGGISAEAQTVTKVDADIPFDFIVGNRAFAAGKYVFRVVTGSMNARAVVISDNDNRFAYTVFVNQNDNIGKGKSELVFDRFGRQATLVGIRTENRRFTIPAETKDGSLASTRQSADKTMGN